MEGNNKPKGQGFPSRQKSSLEMLLLVLVLQPLHPETYAESSKEYTGKEHSKTEDSSSEESDSEENGNTDIDQCAVMFLEDKWMTMFKVFDLNHDKILNRKDLDIQENIFAFVYNLDDCERSSVKNKLHEFWSCLTFDRFDEGLSKETFVTQITQSYRQDKDHTIQQLQKCVDTMVDLLDHDKNGFLAFDEVAVYYKGVNMGNKKLIEQRYRMMCPERKKCCPLQNATDAWTEVLIGNDENNYEAITEIYDDIGMSLDDIVG